MSMSGVVIWYQGQGHRVPGGGGDILENSRISENVREYSRTFENVPEHSRIFDNVPEHSRNFENVLEHFDTCLFQGHVTSE